MNMKTLNEVKTSLELKYHIDNGLSLSECVYRYGSKKHCDILQEVRKLYYSGDIILEGRDEVIAKLKTGEKAIYKGKKVILHLPDYDKTANKKLRVFLESGEVDEETKLPIAKILRFGDPNLKIQNHDKEKADSFQARHQCDKKLDINKAGFWSCNIHLWADHLNLKSSRKW